MNTSTKHDAESEQQNLQPHDRQAEVSLLGGLLIDNAYISEVADKVTEADFYDPKNAIIWRAITKLFAESTPADLVTVTDQLVKDGTLDKIGGRAYLIEVTEDVYSAANCERYAMIIREKAILRKIMHVTQDAYHRAKSQQGEPKDILQLIDTATLKIANQQDNERSSTMLDLGVRFLSNLDDIMQSNDHPEIKEKWIRFGLTDLDNLIFRVEKGRTGLIAAGPGIGKTTLSLQLCDRMSRYGVASVYFLLEDPSQAYQTLVGWATGIPHESIRKGDLGPEQYKRIIRVVPTLQEGLIHFEDISHNPTVYEIRRRLTRLLKTHSNIGLVVIDYVQLLRAMRKYDKRHEELTEISREITLLSGELQLPIITCSQLSREQAKEKRPPELSDLRDCGALEQDARLVIMLWKPWMISDEDKWRLQYPVNESHIYVRKQNSGPTGLVKAVWDDQHVKFCNEVPSWRVK